MTDLTLVELFAGIGGFSAGFERAGVKTVAAVEIDKNARQVFGNHFPEATLFDDVRTVTGDQLIAAGFVPDRGIITGGFPCQDLSIAGRGEGLAGERSGLFVEIVRLLEELHPRWFVLENVPRLLSINGGRDMGSVIGALAECGYGVAYRVLDASSFGVPQRRRRVFFVGCFGDSGKRAAQILFEPEGVRGDSAESGEAGEASTGTVAAGVGVGGAGGVIGTLQTQQRGVPSTDEVAGGQVIVDTPEHTHTHTHISTLQGGGKRGYRIDAEAAAGGHLIVSEL